ncbi:MAG TPA: hypothetical protein VFS05_04095 [Gemmatimonadaceae bacterium]|nr:hypothetical protein [Gemmatimonadaceae bacterium]
MRHFHRTHIPADAVLEIADAFFPTLPLTLTESTPRSRTYSGALGTVTLRVMMEGGHYTRIEAATDQVGESRLDRNVKRFFVKVHRAADPSHALRAAY